jgi:hypothetical protein
MGGRNYVSVFAVERQRECARSRGCPVDCSSGYDTIVYLSLTARNRW